MIDEHAHERAANKMKNNRNGEHNNNGAHPDRNRQADIEKIWRKRYGSDLLAAFRWRGQHVSAAVIDLVKAAGMPYITATHDKNNPTSSAVMKRIGMSYRYSYKELWQLKNFPVIFRMYQLNLDGEQDRVYRKYWDLYDEHFVETAF